MDKDESKREAEQRYDEMRATMIQEIANGHEEYRLWLHWFDEAPDWEHRGALIGAFGNWLAPRLLRGMFAALLPELFDDDPTA